MEAIATDIAVDAAKAVTKMLASRGCEKKTLVWGFNVQLKKLKKKFSYFTAMLDDTENNVKIMAAEKSQFVNNWLQGVNHMACSAENLMDDCAYEMLRRKLEFMKINRRVSFKKKCRKFIMAPSTSFIVFRFRMNHRVKQILSELDELDRQAMDDIGLKPSKSSTASNKEDNMLYKIRKHDAATGSNFIGREADQTKLLQMLRNPPRANQPDIPIIAIVGIGGVGKTSLARHILYHEKVDGAFRKKFFWICVSEDFSVERVLKEMLESLILEKCDLSNPRAITNKLKEELKGEKFLLILDDVWKKNQGLWDSLINELQKIGDPLKSVILITTRNTEVAEKARVVYSHRLEGLSEDDGWNLLLRQKIVDTSNTNQNVSDFEDVGRRIVKRCKCIPLAIKAMGAFLLSKKSPFEWESILTSELWDLPQKDENSIFPSLLLSYNHLPSESVKQCFAYCAIFPKGIKLKKRDLIALWMAQGFLDESKLHIGEDQFGALLNNSFLEEEKEANIPGEIKGYKMNNLLHDLAVYISKTNLLVLKANSKLVDIPDVRHVVINLKEEETRPQSPTTIAKGSLKTISWCDGVPRWDFIISAQYLRVLNVADIGLSEISPTIGQLIHLRYLDLSENNINTLPESICKLYQLQTIRLDGNRDLKKLPSELYKLQNLRHIDRTRHKMLASRGLGLLTKLQTLPPLKLCDGEEGWTIDELGALDKIKDKLHIKGLERVKNKEEARKASLGRKDGILTLKLNWSEGRRIKLYTDEDVLGSLEPHPNIKSLTVSNFRGKRFPCWIKTMVLNLIPLSNLITVELVDCIICEQVPTLGQLPNLEILKLVGFYSVKCIGNEFYESNNKATNTTNADVEVRHEIAKDEQVVLFAALRELCIKDFESLTTWIPAAAGRSAFPNLETLEIINSPELERVPASQFRSLKHLFLYRIGGNRFLDIINYNSLETLSISLCLDLQSLPNFKKTCVKKMMTSLKQLHIRDCPALVAIPTSIGKFTSLESLVIRDCYSLVYCIHDLSNLQRLWDLDLINSAQLIKSLVTSNLYLHFLRSLKIGGFHYNVLPPFSIVLCTFPI